VIPTKLEASLHSSEKSSFTSVDIRSLLRRLFRGTSWTAVGTGAVQLLGLLAAILTARILGRSRYGELGIIQSTISMFGVFAGMAMGITATRFVAQYRSTDAQRAGRFVAIPCVLGGAGAMLISIAIIVLARWLAQSVLDRPLLATALRLAALQIAFDTLLNVQIAVLAGLESFRSAALVQMSMAALRAGATVAGAHFLGVAGCIAAHTLASMITCAALQSRVRAECQRYGIPISLKGAIEELPSLWSFSVPTLMASLVLAPTAWICRVLLVRLPNGYEQMGIYNACLQWVNGLRFLPLRLLTVSMPMLSNLYGTSAVHEYYRSHRFTQLAVLAVAAVIGGGVALFAKPALSLYGRDFTGGHLVLVVAMIDATLQLLTRTQTQVALSRGHAVVDLVTSAIRAALLIGLWWRLTHLGALGLVSASAISYGLAACGLTVYVHRQKVRDFARVEALKKGQAEL